MLNQSYRNEISTITVLLVIGMVSASFLGCGDNDVPIGHLGQTSQGDDYEDGEPQSSVLSAGSPHADSVIDRTLERFEVQRILSEALDSGFSFNREYSFLVEGTIVYDSSFIWPNAMEVDSIKVQAVTIALTPVTGDSTFARYIEFVVSPLCSYVVYYELLFDYTKKDLAYYEVGEGVYRRDLEGKVLSYFGRTPQPMALIFDLLDCIEREAAAGCAAAMIGCAFSGAAWPGCAALGCGLAFIGAVVHCLFTAL